MIDLSSPESIGFHTAHQLVPKGALGARTEVKSAEAISYMQKIMEDISFETECAWDGPKYLKDTRRATNKLLSEESRLDILVNSAGLRVGDIVLLHNMITDLQQHRSLSGLESV